MSKYSNKKVMHSGHKFDSKREANRFIDLSLLESAGHISGLSLQVPFELAKPVKFDGAARTKPALRYVSDFVYTDVATGKMVVEDVKGVLTESFQIKRHLMKSVHGIDVTIIR